MRCSRAITIQLFALFLFLAIALCFVPDAEKNNRQHLNDCMSYDTGWSISDSQDTDTAVYYGTLPSFYKGENGKDAWFSRVLSDVSDGDCIGFFSFQQQVEIYLDDELVYSFVPNSPAKSNTPGNKWNFLPLRAEYNSQTLSIHIYQCYDSKVSVPDFYYGTQSGIALHYLASILPRFTLSLLTIFMGVCLLVFYATTPNRKKMGKEFLYLALFSIFRGLWTSIESNFYSLFISRLLLMSQLSYLCLKMAAITYIHFVNLSFHNGTSKLLHWLTIVSAVDFWLTGSLQALGIADFATTVFITHGIVLVGSLFVCVDTYHTLLRYHTDASMSIDRQRRNTYLTQIGTTIVIMVSSIIDMVRYYLFPSPDVARFCRIGDIIYVIFISYALLTDLFYLIKVGHQAAQIQEEAYVDPMTKLRNRTSFEHDIESVSKRLLRDHSIIMLDLNNLKTFNDMHGHDMGDYYIIVCSEAIRDYFGPYGNAYRIGGDEFCIIARGLKEPKFLELRTTIGEHLNSLHIPGMESLHMSISSGYAAYDAALDHSLRDTMKRADERMYENKRELKAGR